MIPWHHHIEHKSINDAAFYIRNTTSENWSRAILQRSCLRHKSSAQMIRSSF
ncbi:MAG TPA: hypothetical protein IAC03_04045 [Candidatus Coprenecus pullistercoris]|nr:hypothetical protein [Candidatus Coprenecus pullistercoris]